MPRLRPSHIPMVRRGAIAVAAATLLIAGCSSGSESADTPTETTQVGDETATTRAPIDPDSIEGGEQAYVDAITPMIEGSTGLGQEDGERAADCLAPAWVEIIGVETFAEAGIAPEDFAELGGGLELLGLDRETAEEMVAGFETCGIDLLAATIGQMTAGTELPPELEQCFTDNITVADIEAGLVASLTGEENDASQFDDLQACFEANTESG